MQFLGLCLNAALEMQVFIDELTGGCKLVDLKFTERVN